MNIKQAIFSHLSATPEISDIFGSRIRPQFVAMDEVTPYMIFDRQGTETVESLSGVSALRMETFTFIIYADTRLAVESAKEAVQAALLEMRREISENVYFATVCEKTTSDDYDTRAVADQEPAFNEVAVFDFWARPVTISGDLFVPLGGSRLITSLGDVFKVA